jgi:hypothetical protein
MATGNVHMVIFDYDPGRPVMYAVTGAPNGYAAIDAALLHNGYHPGIRIRAYLCRDFAPIVLPEYKVQFRPFNADDKERLHGIRMSSD